MTCPDGAICKHLRENYCNAECKFGYREENDSCIKIEDPCKDVCKPDMTCSFNELTNECVAECSEGLIAEGLDCVVSACKDVVCPENALCSHVARGKPCQVVCKPGYTPDSKGKCAPLEGDPCKDECPESMVCTFNPVRNECEAECAQGYVLNGNDECVKAKTDL